MEALLAELKASAAGAGGGAGGEGLGWTSLPFQQKFATEVVGSPVAERFPPRLEYVARLTKVSFSFFVFDRLKYRACLTFKLRKAGDLVENWNTEIPLPTPTAFSHSAPSPEPILTCRMQISLHATRFNSSRSFALDATSNVCLVGENPTCSVPALQGREAL